MTDYPPPAPLLLVVAAALVRADGHVLLQRRPSAKEHGDLWEFPGGKVEPGETPEIALARELAEELGVVIPAISPVPLSFASTSVGPRHLVLLLYVVPDWQGDPRPLDAAALAWVEPARLADYPMPPADRPLAVALVRAIAAGNVAPT